MPTTMFATMIIAFALSISVAVAIGMMIAKRILG